MLHWQVLNFLPVLNGLPFLQQLIDFLLCESIQPMEEVFDLTTKQKSIQVDIKGKTDLLLSPWLKE